jgi:hypothetical protein
MVLSIVPPATSSSCSSLIASGLLISSLILVGPNKLQVDRAESRGAVLSRDGVVHRTAGNVFELLVADRFWFVNFFAHIGWLGVWFLVGVGARIPLKQRPCQADLECVVPLIVRYLRVEDYFMSGRQLPENGI